MADSRICNACDGISPVTPVPISNRPGMETLSYRIGTHCSFFESMIARLSTLGLEGVSANRRPPRNLLMPDGRNPLEGVSGPKLLRDMLSTRELTDPSIALLDAWATLADVLTFYQERLANEGFLKTAQQRRSLVELARLVGYRLRPGVSAAVYLAFEVDDSPRLQPFGQAATTGMINPDIIIPAGTAAKSSPTPGSSDQPQTFETSKKLAARKEWNAMPVRLTQPTRVDFASLLNLENLYFEGLGLRLSPGDYLALDVDPELTPVLRSIVSTDQDSDRKVTKVTIEPDPLSTRLLIEDIEKRIGKFLTEEPPPQDSGLIKEFQQAVRDQFDQLIKQAYGSAATAKLAGIDTLFHDFLVRELVTTSDESTNIIGLALLLKSWAELVRQALHSIQLVLNPGQELIRLLNSMLNDQNSMLTAIDDHGAHGTLPTDSLPNCLMAVKYAALTDPNTGLWDRIVIGHDVQSCKGLPFVNCRVSIPPSVLNLPVTVKVEYVGSKTILEGNTIASDPGLQEFLAAAEILDLAKESRYVQVTVTLQDTKRVLAAAMMELLPDENPKDKLYGTLQLDNVTLWQPPSVPDAKQYLDADFRCFSDLAVKPTSIGARLVILDVCARRRITIDGSCVGRFRIAQNGSPEGNLYDIAYLPISNQPPSPTDFEEFIRTLVITPVQPGTAASDEGFDGNWIRLDLYCKFDDSDIDLDSCPDASALFQVVRHDLEPSAVRQICCNAVGCLSTRDHCGGNQFQAVVEQLQNKISGIRSAIDSTGGLRDTFSKMQLPTLRLKEILQIRDSWLRSGVVAFDEEIDDTFCNIDVRVFNQFKKDWGTPERWLPDLDSLSNRLTSGRIGPYIKCVTDQLKKSITVEVLQKITQASKLSDFEHLPFDLPSFQNLVKPFSEESAKLADQLGLLAHDIAQELKKRQLELQKRFTTVKDEFGVLFTNANANAAETTVKQRLTDVMDLWTAKIAKTDAEVLDSDCIRLNSQLKSLNNEISNSETPELPGDPLITLLTPLTGESERQLRAIFRRWKELLKQVQAKDVPLVSRSPSLQLQTLGSLTQQVDSLLSGNVPASGTSSVLNLFGNNSDLISQVASALSPDRRESFYSMLRSLRVPATPRLTVANQPIVIEPKVYVFRSVAKVFGWNAAKIVRDPTIQPPKPVDPLPPDTVLDKERCDVVFLDGKFDKCFEDQPAAVRKFNADDPESSSDPSSIPPITCYRIKRVNKRPRTAYGLSGETTQLFLDGSWWKTPNDPPTDTLNSNCYTNPLLQVIRSARVYCDAEQLVLAEEPVSEQYPDLEKEIELVLDHAVFGLSTNKPIIFAGQQIFPFPETSTAQAVYQGAFLIKQVEQKIDSSLFGDRYCTCLTISKPLPFKFNRKSIRIFANVAEATHGESQTEVVGNGNGSSFQQFPIKRPEISQLSWPTPTGVKSTLDVGVNDTTWSEAFDLRDAKGNSEQYVSRVDDSQQATVVFGDGTNGARIPTGIQNVRAVYRTGLGIKGNVDAGRIGQLSGAPLGVKSVSNPLAAKGGADRETIDDARSHTPLAVLGMDRLVSVLDYADFANAYAGIGKAISARLQGIVYVTVAGFDPDPFDDDNQLLVNLKRAYELYGDPSQQFSVLQREISLLVIQARVKIDPNMEWEIVEPQIRSALLNRFQYSTARLAQDILQSDAIATMQAVKGVVYIDVNKFDIVRQQDVAGIKDLFDRLRNRPRISVKGARITSIRQELDELDLNSDLRKAMLAARIASVAGTPQRQTASQPTQDDSERLLSRLDPRAAQLCYLEPKIRDTLVLEQIQ